MKRLGFNSAKDAIGQKTRMAKPEGIRHWRTQRLSLHVRQCRHRALYCGHEQPWSVGYLSVKLPAANMNESIPQIEDVFHETLPDRILNTVSSMKSLTSSTKAEDRL